jgi:hypothetical protein
MQGRRASFKAWLFMDLVSYKRTVALCTRRVVVCTVVATARLNITVGIQAARHLIRHERAIIQVKTRKKCCPASDSRLHRSSDVHVAIKTTAVHPNVVLVTCCRRQFDPRYLVRYADADEEAPGIERRFFAIPFLGLEILVSISKSFGFHK